MLVSAKMASIFVNYSGRSHKAPQFSMFHSNLSSQRSATEKSVFECITGPLLQRLQTTRSAEHLFFLGFFPPYPRLSRFASASLYLACNYTNAPRNKYPLSFASVVISPSKSGTRCSHSVPPFLSHLQATLQLAWLEMRYYKGDEEEVGLTPSRPQAPL